MKPYYQDENTTIYHGDCRGILPHISEVDLIITDPPYGINFQGRAGNFDKITNDNKTFDVTPFLRQALNKLKRGRHVYIFGNFDLSELPLCSKAELIWDKEHFGLGNLEIAWGKSHENITFAIYEISKANRDKGFGTLAARIRRGSVLRSLRPHSAGIKHHPTEKPTDILRQMIESSSLLGETILDPFCGSGSTLVAAKLEGRKSIGIEIEEKYCQIAAERMRQQTLMFSEAI